MQAENSRPKILITDGASVNALGIVRQLGILNRFDIFAVGYNSVALVKFSKYCKTFFLVPPPKSKSREFITEIINICKENKIDFVLPVGFYAHKAIIEDLSSVASVTKLCLPPAQSFLIATSKIETSKLAKEAGVLVPNTIIITDLRELHSLHNLRYPLVIKSPNEIGGRMVEYAHTKEELILKFGDLVRKFELPVKDYPIIQEFIEGEGVGFFAFYKDGKVMASFMHERVREFPVSGGRSVCARSFYNENLEKSGRAVLDALHWNGSAMVEFKRTADNTYYLLEVNPKLWGSIELAICSHVNFPLLMIEDALGITAEKPTITKKQVYFQWCLNGELYHFFNRPQSIFSILKTALHSKKDFWFKDIKPNLMQFLLIFIDLYKVIKSNLRP